MGFLAVAAIGFGTKIIATGIQAYQQGKVAKRAENKARSLEEKIEYLEKERQPVINPYDEVNDLSYLITDLSSQISNPFSSLGVATGAAEIQIEEADIALANTLDTLRATGASAGGATALAQAALQSKKDVAASIELQETQNQKMRAQGEERASTLKLSEARRSQSGLLTEAQRMQQVDVKGRVFEYDEFEKRQMGALNRAQSQLTGQQQIALNARTNQTNIIAQGVTEVGNIGGEYYQSRKG